MYLSIPLDILPERSIPFSFIACMANGLTNPALWASKCSPAYLRKKSFRHLAAGGITGAQEKHALRFLICILRFGEESCR